MMDKLEILYKNLKNQAALDESVALDKRDCKDIEGETYYLGKLDRTNAILRLLKSLGVKEEN